MSWLLELIRRLRIRLNRERFDRDLAEEMRLHVDLCAADRVAQGMSPKEAALSAQRQFGNTSLLQEISRDAWGWTFFDRLCQDLRYAFRAILTQPGFSATAILSLVLGIGANTAIFSIVNAVMLRSLPVEDPRALVQLKLSSSDDDELNTPLWEQIRDNQKAFTGVLAYGRERFNLADMGETQPVQGLYVSGDYFRVLGVPAAMGRAFTPADDTWGGGDDGAVVIVSHRFWRNRMNSDPSAIGRTIRLNRHNLLVVGVTPAWFTGLDVELSYDVAVPIGAHPLFHSELKQADHKFFWWLRILGRLAPGDNLKIAANRMQSIAPQIFQSALPPGNTDARFHIAPAALGFSHTRIQYRTAIFALFGAAGLVLLIACANIANLLAARGAARQRELSVRMAVGASRARVTRQLMTESIVLAGIGAVGGLAVAMWGSRMLLRLLSTTRNPVDIEITPDWRLLSFTITMAVLTAVVFGLAPSLRATRIGLNTVLKENPRGAVTGSTRWGSAKLLVAGQIALSMLLLVGAGLFIATLGNLLTIDPGFDRRDLTLMSVTLPQDTAPEQRNRTFHKILTRVQTTPGVLSAAHSALTPISPQGWAQRVQPEGFVSKSPRDTLLFMNQVSAAYFRTMRTPVIVGREFADTDTDTSPRVMILNQSAAVDFFGNANPVGKTIAVERAPNNADVDVYQVVGIVKDTKYNRLNEPSRRIGYFAAQQDRKPAGTVQFVILSGAASGSVLASVRTAVAGEARGASLEFRSMDSQISESLLQPRLVALLSGIFGGLALLLAMVGLYGTTAYSVAQRKGEIGIRIAMGAEQRSVVWLMMKDIAMPLILGLLAGLTAAIALGRILESLLYGVESTDLGPLAAAAIILLAFAALAAFLPAYRAARLDPMEALREE